MRSRSFDFLERLVEIYPNLVKQLASSHYINPNLKERLEYIVWQRVRTSTPHSITKVDRSPCEWGY